MSKVNYACDCCGSTDFRNGSEDYKVCYPCIKKSMVSMCDNLKTPNEIQDIIDFLGLLKTSMAEVLENKMSLDAIIKEHMQAENSIKCNEEAPKKESVKSLCMDNINSPIHYTQGGIECIDAINAAVINKTGLEAVCVANVVKYLWRYELKNGLEDIKKAQWYLEKLISLKNNVRTQLNKLDVKNRN